MLLEQFGLEALAARDARRAGARARYQQPAWRQLSRFVVARDGWCRECGSTRYLSAHHVVPRNQGGADHPSNLIARGA
jgi:5-methylcytosine-specific restriction endonuclease McrA